MSPAFSVSVFPPTTEDDSRTQPNPDLGQLDFLGRMPIPLRRAFKAGLDRTVTTHRQTSGISLDCCFLTGAEWYHPFDGLASAAAKLGAGLPNMLVSTFHHDILSPDLLRHYTPTTVADPALHPACRAARLADPLGAFRLFAVIPFVFLVDGKRLQGRPCPRVWQDLLDPCWNDEIVFGGWRPNPDTVYQDYNNYLLLFLLQRFGTDGLAAFAGNVRHLQHNILTASRAGSNSASVGTIAILPWLQAELCPRRERTRVVWPEDGALAMPIGYLVKPEAEPRVQALADYLTGAGLGRVLARNCYPPAGLAVADAFPADARLQWLGWDYARHHDLAVESRVAAETFFSAWYQTQAASIDRVKACN